jgi:hypothetical protein
MTSTQGSADDVTLRWVFARSTDRIDLCRSVAPTSMQVDVSEGAVTRVFRFADRPSAVAFHAGFEQALLQTGWTLAAFEPERRQKHDRRLTPRGGDRRGTLALAWSRPQPPAEPEGPDAGKS